MNTRSDYLRYEAYCLQRSELTQQPWIKVSYLSAAKRWHGLANPMTTIASFHPAIVASAIAISPVLPQYALSCPPPTDG